MRVYLLHRHIIQKDLHCNFLISIKFNAALWTFLITNICLHRVFLQTACVFSCCLTNVLNHFLPRNQIWQHFKTCIVYIIIYSLAAPPALALSLLYHSPIVVPSSPIMHFIEVMICSTTGGDMEVA